MNTTITSTECVSFATRTCLPLQPRRSCMDGYVAVVSLGILSTSSFEINRIQLTFDYRHMWYPPGLVLEYGQDHAKFIASEGRHALSEKTIADVCEALIGAALLSGGSENRFDMSIKAVTLFANHSNHTATVWKDYIEAYKLPSYQICKP